ncbi:glycolate oxidase subunit GlcE [Marinobacterium sedimentorum]|uniref:glycolate oxidase subunit GlcE n=1 Tax=Marinobacterium sedimentorum TaxID=2927804 RepID=UPI0020C6D055|nr:glycolate oxidase subunit GlcE [Marinobacterium sedimentorum]MCP8689176.1 glycolate oxidase subunit GlcE [Marinobacterium sedimentorum]
MADMANLLQQQILSARADARKLNIIGGNSKAFMGRVASGEPLRVAGHSGIVSYQPVELVLTARAGTPLTELVAALDEQHQMLSFEPPGFGGGATIGGTLACNQSGPGRPWWSSVRDQVLGVRLLNGRGEHLRFGGQVMKNVAGYDVSRLQAGAMGSLGLITEVSLKVLPKPAVTRTLVFDVALQDAVALMNRRAAEPKPLSAACWLDNRLYLRLSGARAAVDATLSQWQGQHSGSPLSGSQGRLLEDDESFWAALRDQTLAFFEGEAPLWRFSIKSTAVNPDLPGNWLIDWGGAQRWYRGAASMAQMQQLAEAAGGQVSLFRGGDRQADVMHPQARALQLLQQRLKQSFDPDGVFNPGRLYSWM